MMSTQTTPAITLKKMLDWHDGPLLVLAEDAQGRPYLGVWGTPKEVTYLLLRLPKKTTKRWLAGALDTRSAMLEADYAGRFLSGDMPSEGEPYTDLRPYPDGRIGEEFMPGGAWFVDGRSVFERPAPETHADTAPPNRTPATNV